MAMIHAAVYFALIFITVGIVSSLLLTPANAIR